jgi:hypothetical protein
MSEETKNVPAPLQTDERGLVLGSTMEERYRVCQLYVKSGMLPKGYDTAEKAFIGIQYALELGFRDQPLTALKNIAVVNGQPSIWGELPLALVLRSQQLEYIREFFEDKDGKQLPDTVSNEGFHAAVCVVKRKGFEERRFSYTQNDRTTLGVAAIWKQFTKIMMKRKARAIALKDVFPDVLLGFDIGEYSYHKHDSEVKSGDVIEVDHNDVKLAEVNSKFGGAK